ncbi:MAG TPA: hypothetical protein VIL85_03270 [Thermomicrobiales bacterium]
MPAITATANNPRIARADPQPSNPRDLAALLTLLLAAIVCRIPALINAGGVHADAAIIGLQAQHILRGEWAWFIWGTNYQGSVDPLLVALGFMLGGATPLTLMLVPLVGHLLLIGFTFATLRRHLTLTLVLAATLPVVFTPQAINGVALYAPRQWAITLVIAAIWALDGAGESRRPLPRYALGAALGGLALYPDLFAAQFIPALGLFALACCCDGWPARAIITRRSGASAAGLACGLAVLALSRLTVTPSPNSVTGGALSVEQLRRNAALLWEQCLPWLLSYGVYIPGAQLYPDRWQPPAAFALVQVAGAVLLVAGIAWGGLAIVARRLPWPVRRLGLLGGSVAATSLIGFLVSSSPVDMWAARYLAPIVWAAPFALMPAAHTLKAKRFLPALAPYIVAAAVGGWLSFGTYVRGPLPTRDPRGVATEEAELGAALRSRGATYAAAQYWLAYRLTFLWHEAPIVVPLDPRDDRYPPYRHAYAEAATIAYLFDTTDPRADVAPCEASLRATGERYERVTVANFTALVWSRGAGMADAAGCVAATAQQNAPSAKK